MKINQTKPAHPKNTRGGVLVLVALLLVVFVGIAAIAIDIGFLSTTKNELQNVADASALAGAGYLGSVYIGLSPSDMGKKEFTRDEIVKVVQDAAKENQAAGVSELLINDSESDIIIGLWDPDTGVVTPQLSPSGDNLAPDAVYVKARRDGVANSPINTFFAGIFNIETMPVTAEAVAALSGPSTVAPGELQMPVGLSEHVFPNDCEDYINFSPTTASCASWHNFGDDINANAEAIKLLGIIQGDDPCSDCDTASSSGPDWLSNNFVGIDSPVAVTTPAFSAGVDFDFQGGDIASLFASGVYLGDDYDSGLSPGDTGTVIKSNGDVATNTKSPVAMVALFDYFRYRDGDDDIKAKKNIYYDEIVYDEDGTTILHNIGDLKHAEGDLLHGKDEVWTATIPVYKDETEQVITIPDEPECKNTKGRTEILGFANIRVFAPNPPPSNNLQVQVDCSFTVVEGRGGGGSYGSIKGSIPNLVK